MRCRGATPLGAGFASSSSGWGRPEMLIDAVLKLQDKIVDQGVPSGDA
jgi:hypothetical protein